jgi:hypothetical protein
VLLAATLFTATPPFIQRWRIRNELNADDEVEYDTEKKSGGDPEGLPRPEPATPICKALDQRQDPALEHDIAHVQSKGAPFREGAGQHGIVPMRVQDGAKQVHQRAPKGGARVLHARM